jgi:transcription elongation factor GreA-like protein/transcription elongation GreA/GreB family factor
MSYLDDFQTQINNRDFSKFLQLWEEYCTSDTVESEEFILLLLAIKASDFAKLFGQLVESALPLWQTIVDEKGAYNVLKLLFDLQTTNTPLLADVVMNTAKKQYGSHPKFNDWLRLVGLRSQENFQGCLSNLDLLAHMQKGKFVFHGGGWGTGEIVEVSPLREQLVAEFENVAGRKHITFANAFKTLNPLPDDDFRVRRFADADALEKEAKADPVALIKILLRDIGPKTAAEIKEELCELVIPEAEWTKWWQGARAKIKKNTMLETPETVKGHFYLRKKEVTHEERLQEAIKNKLDANEIIQTTYSFVRDMPAMLKKSEIRDSLKSKLISLLEEQTLTTSQIIQVLIILDVYFAHQVQGKELKSFVRDLKSIEQTVNLIDIIAVKKRALTVIKEVRNDWIPLFLSFLVSITQSSLRDYIVAELNQKESKKLLLDFLTELLKQPKQNPELFFWYFQKLVSKDKENEGLPFYSKEGQCQFFEGYLILLHALEGKPEYRDFVKKMYQLLAGKRYAVVRSIIEGSSLTFIKEFLLLASKCQIFSDHDLKILHSLAEVVHPSLASTKVKKSASHDTHIFWTTEAGYLKTQEKAVQLGTVEVVENAKEIEAARALGDLRENSEYKFALEKRSRLQTELKTLSDQLSRARLITPDDISLTEIGVGNVVMLKDQNQHSVTYTILGQWDADPDAHILSLHSKFAQAMCGRKVGESVQFRDEEFQILSIKSYLQKE